MFNHTWHVEVFLKKLRQHNVVGDLSQAGFFKQEFEVSVRVLGQGRHERAMASKPRSA